MCSRDAMTMMISAVRVVLALLVAASLSGCRDASPGSDPLAASPEPLAAGELWRPALRFAAPSDASALTPTATIGDETRPVLRAFEPAALNYAPSYDVPEDGRVRMQPPLPASFSGEPVFVAIHLKRDDRWQSLPGRLVTPVFERGKLRVPVELELPESAGREAGIWVQAIEPMPAGAPAVETGVFEVPPRARLDLALGILEAAWDAGPVRFAVEACEASECVPLLAQTLDPADASSRGFQPRSLGLQALAGRSVFLRFEARGTEPDSVSLPIFADPVLLVPETTAAPARSLVLISLDTLRADHMGVYGYARDTTPFIDELAASGTLFLDYVAAASSTRPSHMTMFTGLQPSVHGTTENAGIRALPRSARTLAEALREAGIATAAFTENGAIDRSRGFGRGFDVYVENRDASSADLRTGHIEKTFAEGLAWLDGVGGRRFFLFLHTYQVHNPFTPPPAYERFFTGDPGPLARPPELREDWDPLLYDREIRYADDGVRELVRALRERGLDESTYVVLTSDHGEAFLEHGFVAHGANVHREVVNVPLLVVGPDVPAGRRLEQPVPMVDLMPTVLALLDAPGVEGGMGRSQADVLRGAEETERDRPIYSEAWAERAYRARGFEDVSQPTLALRLGYRKLVRARVADAKADRFRYELYDLAADPQERVDLFEQQRDEPATADLVRLLQRYDAIVKGLHDRLGERDAQSAAQPETPTDPDLQEKLRALGYLE